MSDVVATYRHPDHPNRIVEIFQDCEVGPLDPLESEDWFRFLTVKNNSYEHGHDQLDAEHLQEVVNEAYEAGHHVIPVYFFDHSQIGFSLSNDSYPYNCPWDGGQCGFVVVDPKKQKDAGLGTSLDKAVEVLSSFMKRYTEWANGWALGWAVIDLKKCDLGHEHREVVDSCGGYLGLSVEDTDIMDTLPFSKDGWKEV